MTLLGVNNKVINNIGCHGVNTNTEHRHREKNRFHRVDRKYYRVQTTTCVAIPLVVYYTFNMKLQIASIVCLLQGWNFDVSRLARDSCKIHVRQVHLGLVLEILSVNLIGSSF